MFLNQAYTGRRLARAWFLKIDPMQIVSMHVYVFARVCPPPRLLITSGVICTAFNWLKKFYSCYMANVVIIINGHGLGIDMLYRH